MTNHWPYPVQTFGRLPGAAINELADIRMPFQKPERLDPIWINLAHDVFYVYSGESQVIDCASLELFLKDLKELGFVPEDDMRNELLRLA